MEGAHARDGDEPLRYISQCLPDGMDHHPKVHLRHKDRVHLRDQFPQHLFWKGPQGDQTQVPVPLSSLASITASKAVRDGVP